MAFRHRVQHCRGTLRLSIRLLAEDLFKAATRARYPQKGYRDRIRVRNAVTTRVILTMKEVTITVPELALIAGTRAALGAGIALLLSDRFGQEQRRAVGWTLLTVGVISTMPLALDVLGKIRGTSGPKPVQPEGAIEGNVT